MKTESLDRRMRSMETFHGHRISPDAYIVVRVDGRGFSKFSKEYFNKPFDPTFQACMAATARELHDEFGAIYTHTHSDEISIVLPRNFDMFDRDPEKLATVAAGTASGAFTSALARLQVAFFEGPGSMGSQAVKNGKTVRTKPYATFDARVVVVPRWEGLVDYFRWRMNDASRNAINDVAYWKLVNDGISGRQAATKLEGLGFGAKYELLYNYGINFTDLPDMQRRGVALYSEKYVKEGYNPKTGETVTAVRSRVVEDQHLPYGPLYDEFLMNILQKATPPGDTL